MHGTCDDAGPAGLMAGAEASAVVPMEIFVKENQIAPVRVLLKFLGAAVDRPPTVFVLEKDIRQPSCYVLCYLVQVHLPPGAGWAFDSELVSEIQVVLHQRTDDESVDRHPDRSAPIGIAAEHPGVGLRRQIVDSVLLPAGGDDV